MTKLKGNTSSALNSARIAKNDEFYTQFSDIEAELRHYREQFCGKIVFCNCDDPYESNFFKYFALNFNTLGLKKLMATCYAGSPIANTQLSLFDHEPPENKTTKNPHKIEISTVPHDPEKGLDLTDVEYLLTNKKNVLTRLKGNGDFRSLECIELMKQSDIVVTNPPFSLFREYVVQLMEHEKKFVIIGHQNAITYKAIFQFIRDNKLWIGYNNFDNSRFIMPDNYDISSSKYAYEENGIKYGRVSGLRWFTNLETTKRHDEITLYMRYSPEKYPKYENYDAIEVAKVVEIPADYEEYMGVPVTFLDKYNPKQFEIIWTTDRGGDGQLDHIKIPHARYDAPVVAGQGKYKRIIIRKKENTT